jgi:hypothetical protein
MFKETPPSGERKEKPFDLEHWLSQEFKTQYEQQAQILNMAGVLEILPHSKDIGIIDINGQERPFPEEEAIRDLILERKEFFSKKMEQGFTELEIVPIPPLDKLVAIAREIIIKHHKEGKLFATRINPDDPAEPLIPLELDENEPLWVWDDYKGADKSGKMVYFPKVFSRNHGGKTKAEVMLSMGNSPLAGYLVTLREKNINIPGAGKGITTGGRKQLEANQSPNDYLEIFKNRKEYQGEEGDTPEEWLIKIITHLEKTNEVIDDYQGNGSASYQTGAFFPASGSVPGAGWFRGSRRASLLRSYPGHRDGSIGVRPAVRVNKI